MQKDIAVVEHVLEPADHGDVCGAVVARVVVHDAQQIVALAWILLDELGDARERKVVEERPHAAWVAGNRSDANINVEIDHAAKDGRGLARSQQRLQVGEKLPHFARRCNHALGQLMGALGGLCEHARDLLWIELGHIVDKAHKEIALCALKGRNDLFAALKVGHHGMVQDLGHADGMHVVAHWRRSAAHCRRRGTQPHARGRGHTARERPCAMHPSGAAKRAAWQPRSGRGAAQRRTVCRALASDARGTAAAAHALVAQRGKLGLVEGADIDFLEDDCRELLCGLDGACCGARGRRARLVALRVVVDFFLSASDFVLCECLAREDAALHRVLGASDLLCDCARCGVAREWRRGHAWQFLWRNDGVFSRERGVEAADEVDCGAFLCGHDFSPHSL
eukprot:comp19751_c0_seq1/m.38071 comp19751_c0_seq1/g.38071  ORF comp19751_c0_seq1/g.38071 comp19751_c0_seq1/m.38071 type:complete len:395 (+) comp19751_c0_seq1:823-2007(+)